MRLDPIRGLAALSALTALFLAAGAAAAEPKAVVELFTSQGCSSCPPADALLRDLARRPDVIALSMPVDYWDYLGWKDTLALPAFSARQRAYAGVRGDRQVYTPQALINGGAHHVGSDRGEVEQALGRSTGLKAPVSVAESGSVITVEVGGAPGVTSPAGVWLMPVTRSRAVAIGRGENRGRSVTYVNVVRGMTRIGSWSGASARFEAPLSIARAGDADSYVVVVQAAGPGPILGAARGRDF